MVCVPSADKLTTGSLVLLGLLALLTPSSEGCSPGGWVQRTPVQRIHEADIALYGKIVRHHADTKFEHYEHVFTAEMEVHCVLKGPKTLRTRQLVNITEAGSVPGMCHSTTLDIGSEYILTLRNEEQLIPTEVQLDAAENLQKVFMACGLQPFTPEGVSPSQCPAVAGPDSCTPNIPPTRRPPPTRPTYPVPGPVPTRKASAPGENSPPSPPAPKESEMQEGDSDNGIGGEVGAVYSGTSSPAAHSLAGSVVMATIYLIVTCVVGH